LISELTWLTIRDLSHGCASGSLDLTVGDLSNGLWLSVTDLSDSNAGSPERVSRNERASDGGSILRLAIRELGHSSGDGWLAVRGHCSSWGWCRATTERKNVDVVAGVGPVAVVQVVESAAVALSPDCGRTVGERAVGAKGKARGVDGTSLGWCVKLELIVGGNVTSSAGLVLHHAIGESDGKRSIKLTLSESIQSLHSSQEYIPCAWHQRW
jgi:hypothetical protein